MVVAQKIVEDDVAVEKALLFCGTTMTIKAMTQRVQSKEEADTEVPGWRRRRRTRPDGRRGGGRAWEVE